MSANSSSASTLIFLALVGLLIAGVATFFLLGGRPAPAIRPPVAAPPVPPPIAVEKVSQPAAAPGDPGERLSLAEKRELLKLSHQALGHLENAKYREALADLDKIFAKLPEDSFATRNAVVAVSQEVKLARQITPDDLQLADVEKLTQRALQKAPRDPVTQILAARIAAKMGDGQLALKRYQQAVEVDPKSAVGWYELFDTLRGGALVNATDDRAQVKLQQKDALRHVLEMQPQNLRARLDILEVMADTHDPQIVEVLKGLEPQMPLLARLFQEKIGNDQLQKLYTKSIADVTLAVAGNTAQDWATVSARVRPIRNLMSSLDPVFQDLGRLKPNSLDFVQHRFASLALNSPETDPAEFHPEIDVKLALAAEQLPINEPPLDVRIYDFNLDQRSDVWVLTAGKLRIFGTTKDSAKWTPLSELAVPEGMTQFLARDLDWDDTPASGTQVLPQPEPVTPVGPGNGTSVCHQADCDLIVFGPAGIRIWKNDVAADGATRNWVAIEKTGLEGLTDITTLALADIDHEGDLDLAVGTKSGLRLWSNREGFTFKDVSEQSTLPDQFAVRQIIPVDFDRDVDMDLLIFGEGDAKVTAGILLNRLHGVLEWRTFAEQNLAQFPDRLSRAVLIDADRNVSWDLIGYGPENPLVALTQTNAPGQTHSLRTEPLPELLSDGVNLLDYDNDGILDLVTWAGKELQLLRGSVDGKFVPRAGVAPHEVASAIQECQAADLDRDGDLELVVRTAEGVQILNNDGGNRNHWLDVRLRAQPKRDTSPSPEMASRRVNHQGIGSVLEIEAGGYYLPQVVTSESMHFGLGKRTGADLLRVVWTNGVPQGIVDVKGDWELCELQSPKGSCPFAYTWNGERFEFFTDLLWNAPLGLQFAEGVLAPARQWEYLKIPGDRLHPKAGNYVLQITEELWEATYFDEIELLAVDHPSEVQIYSNEKVGPPELAEFKIHTVRDPRPVVAAHDQRGRDLFTTVAAEDGDFTRSYDRVLRQGLTTEHWLELDLGPIEKSGPLTLFLTGWMYPTETSISVAVSQNPENKQARPPALWVPDAQGQWREIRPFMGFPGGKTKTVAIDLAGVFAGNDHRLRIVTNMQFHWDHAFYAAGETPAEVSVQPLRLESADLHYRGLSQHYWLPGNGPDQYDYSHVLPGPEWPPMQGLFTRYGDVRKLLTKADDQLAVIGAGDEITVTFTPPKTPLPAGWKRDFILHSVGWDKDADLNTVSGQTVEPLPFNAMTRYPDAGAGGPSDSPEYCDYLQNYQTRVQDYGGFWRRVQRHSGRQP